MRPFTVFAAFLLAICAAAVGAEESAPPEPLAKAQGLPAGDVGTAAEDAPLRMCFGGYEDGKVVVPRGRVQDAAAETTASACRIDGGADARAPQSPLLTARRFAVLV